MSSTDKQPEVLPFITEDQSGIGGRLKSNADHFRVEEIPLYNPQGSGQHVYVRMTREEMTTKQLETHLRRIFELPKVAVGYAGLKDKYARATQTFSLDLPNTSPEDVRNRIRQELPVTVESVERHRNKLGRGHLIGNRFFIVVSGIPAPSEAYQQAQEIRKELTEYGLPNFFGRQRFGKYGDNAQRGKEILLGKHSVRKAWLRKLLMHAYQSELFNRWLTQRIRREMYNRIFRGDIARVEGTGGLFTVEDASEAQSRFDSRGISYTGPIYGQGMWEADGKPGNLEREVIQREDITEDVFVEHSLNGNRRQAVIFPDDIEIGIRGGSLFFDFTLPKGAYATVLMREFMKNEST